MGRITIMAAALLAAFCAAAPARAQAPGLASAEGDWTGTLRNGPAELHLAVHLRRAGSALSGTLDSIDQGSIGMPLAAVSDDGGRLSFDVPAVGGHYSGAWDASAKGFSGEWTQQGARLPLALTRGAAAPRPAIAGLDGDWDGVLKLGLTGSLRLVFHIRTGAAGTVATLESPDQGAGELPFTSIARQGAKVVLESRGIGARFEGTIAADDASIAGRWTQAAAEAPLTMTRRKAGGAAPAARARPQTPQRPYPYREVEVAFDNPAGRNRLAGTLTLPPGKGPFPAALLITGSGLQDRDETLVGHKPFLVLADYLTRCGIAVLRVDDRSIGGSTGDPKGTTLDFATDTEAGLAYLLTRPEIDRRRIGLIGHSEGGVIAPIVAGRSPAVAWLVLMAGPGVPGSRIIVAQQRLIMLASGVPADVVEKSNAVQQKLVDAVARAPDRDSAAREAKAILAATGMPAASVEANAAALSSDWYRAFLKLDPAPALRAVHVPVLALIGSLDLQVPAAENLPALRTALAGNRQATVVELPGLNHLFQTAKTGAVSEYGEIEETLSPLALKTIGDWIGARVK